MTSFRTAIVIAAALITTSASAKDSAVIRDAIEIHQDLDQMCRGDAGADPRSSEVCDIRTKMEKLLSELGARKS